MEDALVRFVTTGKGDFKSLANSILADLARVQIRSLVAGAGGSGGLIGGIANLLGTSGAAGLASSLPGDSLDNFLSITGIAGARAAGGPVNGGSRYLVGELGPELFIPKTPGTIVPNHAMGAGGVTVQINNPVYQIGSNISRPEVYEGVQAGNRQLKAEIVNMLRSKGVV
jgi:phage-related minor tail protein